MRSMLSVLLALGVGAFALAEENKLVPAPADRPTIDIVFAIDCSGSMGGVIETAKAKVWGIVNEVAKAKPAPVLRIGLIGYGNGSRDHRMFALSDDLDLVYKNLSSFKDEGWGDEYVGLAIHKATTEMDWAKGKHVLKIIYMVGNETARQGPKEMDYSVTAPVAIKQGILVNAIYCGTTDFASATPTWREMAKLADGQYMEIGSEGGAVTVATPFDADLAKLNGDINKTYVTFGAGGQAGAAAQEQADAMSAGKGGATLADRAVAKSAVQYNNARWDLVDAVSTNGVKLEDVKEADLPENMKKMSLEQRKQYVAEQQKQRAETQKQIQELAAKREAFIKAEIEKRGLDTDKAFDKNVKESLRKQASDAGFSIE